METEENKNIETTTPDVISRSKYEFDFEQYDWNNQMPKTEMSKNALKRIEIERQNIEKDLKILEVIQNEKVKQEDIKTALLQLKQVLEIKVDSAVNF